MFRRHFQLTETDRRLSGREIGLLLATQASALGLHVAHVPLWLSSVCGCLLLWRWWRLRKGELQPLPAWLKNTLAFLLLVIFGAINGLTFNVETAIAFFLLTYSLKLLELREYRDAFLFICLSFFLQALVFLFGQGLLETALVALALLLPVSALRQLHCYDQRLTAGFAVQLGASIRFLAVCLPLLAFFYVAFPRVGPLWSMPLKSDKAFSGLSESMTPGQIAELAGSSERAFRVTFAGQGAPSRSEMYWRAIILDRFDGRSWTRSAYQEVRDRTQAIPGLIQDRGWDYEVLMEPHNQHWGYSLRDSVVAQGEPRVTPDGLVWFQKTVKSATRYRLASTRVAEDKPLDWRYTRLPDSTNPRTRELVEAVRAEYPDDEAFIAAWLQQYREKPFYYTLKPPLLMGPDTVDQFLFDTRRGFCEHFASSMAVALRFAGIPSRVVTGYQGGEYNIQGEFWALYQYDAHAWVEAWLPDAGWVRLDPTAQVAPSRIESSLRDALQAEGSFLENEPLSLARLSNVALAGWVRMQLEYANYLWHEWVVHYDQNRQANLFSDWFGASREERIAWLSGILLGGVVLVFGLGLYWGRGKRSVLREEEKLLRLLSRKLQRRGFPVRPGYTSLGEIQQMARDRAIDSEDALTRCLEELRALAYARESRGSQRDKQIRATRSHIRALKV